MGDMEFDAMDDMDYSDDYESGATEDTSDSRDNLRDQESELDQVARLLAGEEVETSGSGSTRSREFSSRSIGADGRPDYSSQSDALAQAPQQSTTRYGYNADTPGSQELLEQRQQAEQVWNQAHAAKEEIERRHAEGLMTDAEAEAALNLAGQYAGMSQRAMLENELAQRNMKDYQRDAYGHIAKEFDINPNDTEAVNEALGQAVSFLRAQGIADADIASVDDPAIAITAIRAHRAIERDSAQRDEIAGLKAQVRRLKKARGEGRRSGRKASQVGVRGDKQDAMLNEVMDILSGAGAPKGGRR